MTTTSSRGSITDMLASLACEKKQGFGVGFVSMPHAIVWVRRRGDQLMTCDGPLNLAWAYEARLFGLEGELRWRWCEDHGEWSLLDDAVATARGWTPLAEHGNQRTRILRGQAQAARNDGWTSLWDGHSAPFEIPLLLAKNDRAALVNGQWDFPVGGHVISSWTVT